MAYLIDCKDVSLSYDGLRSAVDGVSFTVKEGSIFALLGPNGAGKTSTLRMLATLTDPTSGTMLVDGIDVREDPIGVRRRIGYLPDSFALYEALTPVDYLDFFARCHGLAITERRRRTDELLTQLDLDGKRGVQIRSLSRGMRQRLGLAKTLLHDPKVLLLDEPASALDPGARMKLRDVLIGLKHKGLAIVISSHILPDLAGMADAVGIMEGGRMVRTGSLDEIVEEGAARRQSWTLEIRAHADRAERVFADFGKRLVNVERRAPHRFAVTLDGGSEAAADLVESLVLRGVRVSHLAPAESQLESIYRQSAASQVA